MHLGEVLGAPWVRLGGLVTHLGRSWGHLGSLVGLDAQKSSIFFLEERAYANLSNSIWKWMRCFHAHTRRRIVWKTLSEHACSVRTWMNCAKLQLKSQWKTNKHYMLNIGCTEWPRSPPATSVAWHISSKMEQNRNELRNNKRSSNYMLQMCYFIR